MTGPKGNYGNKITVTEFPGGAWQWTGDARRKSSEHQERSEEVTQAKKPREFAEPHSGPWGPVLWPYTECSNVYNQKP